jgi:hypothetical protein
MPLAGVVAGLSMKLSGLWNFWGARLGFIIIAGFLVPLTAYLAYTFTPRRWAALLAGSLSLFSGFYYAYLPTTETFGIYMVLGGIFFLLVMRMQSDHSRERKDSVGLSVTKGEKISRLLSLPSPIWIYFLMGICVGFMYLTRADGLIWLGLGSIAILLQAFTKNQEADRVYEWKAHIIQATFSLLIYLVCFVFVTSPLIFRNFAEFGSIFAPGSIRAVWLTSYDELYTYPASQLTFDRWMASGISEIMKARSWAFGLNLLNAFAVQGEIFLLPLILAGMWTHRKDWRVSLGALAWMLIFMIMTLVFPFQGARGGFFHAGAALQPLFWALVPTGLLVFVRWGKRRRKWDTSRALKIFGVGVAGLAILVTFFSTWQRLGSSSSSESGWGKTELAYQDVEFFLEDQNVLPDAIVMVNNPPGYFAMTGRQAIVIPHGDLQTSLQVGRQYKAHFLILDENYPQGLEKIYLYPGDYPGLRYIGDVGEMRIYLLENEN